ncbi:MAG: DUF3048 domain-containing protein [Acidimicrobiia bacterium]
MVRAVRLFALIVAAASLASACSSSTASVATDTTIPAPLTTLAITTTDPPTTTTEPTTTTTTEPPVVVADSVNGLEASPEAINRRAVVIKIDNSSKARPQSGLMEADLVYEMLVEGGITRFAAVFHQSDLDYVGPVRSGRPTDVGVVRPLDAPFQVSGAQWWVQDIFQAAGLRMAWDRGVATWRENHRAAPHNLYASSILLRGLADDSGWPDDNPGNVFTFGEPTVGTEPATTVAFHWSDHPDVVWKWNGEAYERFNGDDPHMWVDREGNEGQVSVPVIVSITGHKHWSSPPDGNGSSVPTTDTKGSGAAHVFMNGTVIEGTWQRDSYDEPLHLTTDDGNEIVLPPSRLWIAFFPHDRSITWE